LTSGNWWKTAIHPQNEEPKLQHLYRSLDFFAEEKKRVEKGLANKLLDLFSVDLEVFSCDTTLVTYQSEGEEKELVKYSRNAVLPGAVLVSGRSGHDQ